MHILHTPASQILFPFPNRFSAAGHLQRERDGPDCGGGGSASAALGGRQVSHLYSGPYPIEQLVDLQFVFTPGPNFPTCTKSWSKNNR